MANEAMANEAMWRFEPTEKPFKFEEKIKEALAK